MSDKTLILSHADILRKINRMTWQVLENNHLAKEIYILGIKERGWQVAQLLVENWKRITDIPVISTPISRDAVSGKMVMEEAHDLSDKYVLVVDDVLNSGKTLIEALIPVINNNPAQLETAILANRDHKNFPVSADFVGISLATTLQEHISFTTDAEGEMSVWLS